MYSTRANLVLGFHGCDRTVRDKVVSQKDKLKKSENTYDWLGSGFYFWEYSPARALSFATEKMERDKKRAAQGKHVENPIRIPSVLGAIICLGRCLDLLDEQPIRVVKNAHEALSAIYAEKLKINKDFLRELDCQVIEYVHNTNAETNGVPYDSVRAAFFEGKPLYPTAGFQEKNHIQICICNPNCIKGYFIPLDSDEAHRIV